MLQVDEYLREDGSNPYRVWFERLSAQAAAKVATATYRLASGNVSAIKWFAGIGELKIDWGPGYRIYLAKDGDTLIVLFGGGTKVSQAKDIVKAKALHVEYKARKRALKYIDASFIPVVNKMALTRHFKDTILERVQREPAFAKAMLDEAATLFLNGEPDSARAILRDLVNATVGFEQLAVNTDKNSKSLHRMLSPSGNPSMDNLATIFGAVSKQLKVDLKVRTVRAA